MKSPLKVLFLSPTVASYVGGTETVVTQLAQRLGPKLDLSVLSASAAGSKPALEGLDSVEFRVIPFLGRDTRLNHVFSKVLMTSRFKIESHSFFWSLAKSSIDLSPYDRIVTFYEADAYLLEKKYPLMHDRFVHLLPGVSMRRFFRRVPAARVHFFGYRAAPRANHKWGVKVPSLPLGVDTQYFPEQALTFPTSRRLVFVGRLDKSKHVDWLADFFASSTLPQRGYALDIVGDGPLLDGLKARHAGRADIVFHGRRRQDEVIEILRNAFLLLHPTDLESFGLTILEAMAAGIPVITHGLDSIRIWAGDHPRYARHLDAASWQSEILTFEQAARWEETSATNLAFARGFTWDRIADQVLEIIQRP